MKKNNHFLSAVMLAVAFAFGSPAPALQVIKQFEETSYYLKDICFISTNTGWAVGDVHWDQTAKQYVGTVVKSVDGGKTWMSQATGVRQNLTGVSFVNSNCGWAVGENGTILHTSDGGTHWTRQPVNTTNDFKYVAFVDANNGWATAVEATHTNWSGDQDNWRASIWHTGDGGATWMHQTVPDSAAIMNRIRFVDSQSGWVAGVKCEGTNEFGDFSFSGAVYHTTNGGQTWTERFDSHLDISFTGVDFTDATNGWVVGYLTSSGVTNHPTFHTTDGGETWVEQSAGSWLNNLWDVHFVDSKKGYAVGSSDFVYRTQNGGTDWEQVHFPNNEGEGVYAVSVVSNLVVAVGDHDFLALSTNAWGTVDWEGVLLNSYYINTHYRFESVYFVDDQNGWVSGRRSYQPQFRGQFIFHTSDGGTNWFAQYDDAPDLSTLFAFDYQIESLCFTDATNGWAVGGSKTVYGQNGSEHHGAIMHTKDGGMHWAEQGSNLYSNWDLEFLSVKFTDSRNGWALATQNPGATNGELFLAHTTNGGTNWSWVDTGLNPDGFGFSAGEVDIVNGQNIWAAGDEKIIYSADGGANWEMRNSGSDYQSFITIQMWDTQTGWMGGHVSGFPGIPVLYCTTNGGVTWLEKPTPVPYGPINSLKFTDRSNIWLVAGYGGIAHTADGGETWSSVDSGTGFTLLGLSTPTSLKRWAVGEGGVILLISDEASGPAPQLHIARSNNTAIISWPSPSTGWTLQCSSNLATAGWTHFSGVVNSNSATFSVTLPSSTGNLFFRLLHP